jgi:hypothetical protein
VRSWRIENATSRKQRSAGRGTFETDVSETGDDGTTVRQAEVNEDDVSEVKNETRLAIHSSFVSRRSGD